MRFVVSCRHIVPYCGAWLRPRPPEMWEASAYQSTPAFLCANFTENHGMPQPNWMVKGHEIDNLGGGSPLE